MNVRPFEAADAEAWDEFVDRSANGVFLHTRRFLSYHGDRFTDRSLVLESSKGEIIGLFPAAEMPGAPQVVCSHPGATYGGLLYEPRGDPEEVLTQMSLIENWYRTAGYQSMIYKTVPHHVRKILNETDFYCLWRRQALVNRRDLWSVIDLQLQRRTSKGHRWGNKEAERSDLSVGVEPVETYPLFHRMLQENLAARYQAQPVHSSADLIDLHNRFPGHIELWGCRSSQGELVAGTWIFKLHRDCWHTQYITSTLEGRRLNAVHLLLERAISAALALEARIFSFGANTADEGQVVNTSLYQFKTGFGAGTAVQDVYGIRLQAV